MKSVADIKQIVQQLVVDALPYDSPEDISEDSNLFNCGLDSINLMILTNSIQDEFDILFEPNDITLDNFENVVAIVELVNQKKQTDAS